MLPTIEVFGRVLPMYGLTTAVGILLSVLYFKLRERECRELSADLELGFVYGLIGTGVGAKLLSLLTVLPNMIADLPLLKEAPIVFFQYYIMGGFVFYGGLYGAILGSWLYCKASKTSFDGLMRILLPVIPIVHGFGRVGCICVGCCYGKPAGDFPLAMVFTRSEIAPNGVPLYPVQLAEVILEVGLFLLLHRMSRKGSSAYKMMAVYGLIYAPVRFCLEFLRGDEYRGFLFGASTSQIISVITILLCIWLLIAEKRRNYHEKAADSDSGASA